MYVKLLHGQPDGLFRAATAGFNCSGVESERMAPVNAITGLAVDPMLVLAKEFELMFRI